MRNNKTYTERVNIMDSVKVSFQDAVFENEYMWVFDNLIQSICKININSFQMEVVSCYKGKERFFAQKIFLLQDRFYLVARTTQEVLIYDRKKEGKDSAFCLQKPLSEDGPTINVAFFLYGNKIYFFPKYIDKRIVCFDICKKKYFQKTLLKLPQDIKVNDSNLIIGESRFYRETMWFILRGMGLYGKYNFSNEKCEFFYAENVDQVFNGVSFDGEQVWQITNEKGIVRVGKQIVQVPGQYSFTSIYPIEDGELFLSPDNGKLVFIGKKNFEVVIINLPLNEKEKQNIKGYFYCEHDSNVYLFSAMNDPGPLLVLDKKDWKVSRVDLKCEGYIGKCFRNRKILFKEDECINLECVLQFCKQDVLCIDGTENVTEIGKNIWKTVR